MSWFQGLAGKAENILNKIDQNAANVLQNQQQKNSADVELLEVTTVPIQYNPPILPRIASKGALSLSKAMITPKKTTSITDPQEKIMDILQSNTEEIKSEKQSNLSSRRSSFSSKCEGTVVDVDSVSVASGSARGNSTNPPVQVDYSTEKELAATKIVLAEIKSERDELKLELENVIEQLKHIDSKRRVQELEDICQALCDEKEEILQRLASTEQANAKYIKSISELESTVSKHLQNEVELSQKSEMAKLETEHAVSELQQYRARAQTTLQLKEKMIEQLKLGSPANHRDIPVINNAEQILSLELEQLKNEKQNLMEEISMLNERLEQSKSYTASVEEKYKALNVELESKLFEMQANLSLETTKWVQLEDDLKIQNRELVSAREELIKQRTSFSVKLHDKETEITKLKNRVWNRPVSPSSDLEERLHSLTQSLVQKQTSLEATTAERNALRLQLEKLDNQHQSTITQIRQQRIQIINANETDDAKSQVPNFMVENPFDNNVARRVKRAYSSLDSVGIRLGVFMRRYPLVRILVIFYVIMLHLWVMLVLFSSTPT